MAFDRHNNDYVLRPGRSGCFVGGWLCAGVGVVVFMKSLIILLAAGAIAYNGTLADVHNRRNVLFNENLPSNGFVCRIGVQARYADLLGESLWFYSVEGQSVIGPMLVVDMAASDHAGLMERDKIVADSDCDWLVHNVGILILPSEKDYSHPDIIRLVSGGDVIPRSRAALRRPHSLCGAGRECHWKVERWAWGD